MGPVPNCSARCLPALRGCCAGGRERGNPYPCLQSLVILLSLLRDGKAHPFYQLAEKERCRNVVANAGIGLGSLGSACDSTRSCSLVIICVASSLVPWVWFWCRSRRGRSGYGSSPKGKESASFPLPSDWGMCDHYTGFSDKLLWFLTFDFGDKCLGKGRKESEIISCHLLSLIYKSPSQLWGCALPCIHLSACCREVWDSL